MNGIFGGLQTIINTILGPIKWIAYIIEEIYEFGELLLATVSTVITNITTMPEWLLKYVILSVSAIVILRILGRSTQ